MRKTKLKVRKSAAALANLLDENKDEQVLKEACLGLCQLFGEGIQNDRIQAILEANVVPKLVALLRPSKSRTVPISVQSAALQVLGNVACGDDRQTQVVIDSDALPCLRALLSSSDRGIRKEVCWIVSNITESSHQVQDVLDADILPPLLKLLDNQDTACREDATWVLFNLSSNRDPRQISYLAEKNGVRALCNLLACPKDLDVLWKGCGTVAAVALKGLRNILICGMTAASSSSKAHNHMAALVAEAHGVERIETLTNHEAPDVRNRARLILERMFGTEQSSMELTNSSNISPSSNEQTSASSLSLNRAGCSCPFQQPKSQSQIGKNFSSNGIYQLSNNLSASAINNSKFNSTGIQHNIAPQLHQENDTADCPGSSSGSSTDSDPEDDDSDSDLIPPRPPPCSCLLCTDTSPLIERRLRGRASGDDHDSLRQYDCNNEARQICNFCSGGGRLGDGRSGMAAKLGRAVRLGHLHCLAVLLSRMTWSQRTAATEAPALLHPGGGPPDSGLGNSLPAVVLAAQLGKPDCLGLLLGKCRPDLDITHGKKRLTALSWAAHKGYMRCCELLIEHGANPAIKCGDGVTALHLAASGGGHVEICKLLIDRKAPVNARSCKKQTPLCLAAQKGLSKVVQLLLEHGADPNNEDEGKYTPLHLAASKGFDHCVELLLNYQARVDALTRKGVTPLHYAVQGGHAAVVRLLISAGAQVNCTHKPLLLIAADDGNVEIVHILLDAHAVVDCRANIRAMLDKDTEVSDYLTPLHLASSKAHHEVAELLLSRGADVNEVTTKRGWSALDFSVLNGHANCAITLLKHGAFVTDNCKTIGRNNWTLVQYAANHGAKDVVRLLIQRLKEQRKGISNLLPCSTGNSSGKPSEEMETSENNIGTADSLIGTYNANASSNSLQTTKEVVTSHTSNNTSTSANVMVSDDAAAHIDYLNVDEGCAHIRDGNQPQNGNSSPQPAHRYDPRSLEGDEVGFGTGSGYGINSGSSEASSSKSRRRVVKDDRQNTIRAREMKRRELEANEARDRLEEAMNQKSVSKLTEAIAHVSKLVLHLATSVGNDTNPGSPGDSSDSNGLDILCNDNGHIHGSSTDGTGFNGVCSAGANSNNSSTSTMNGSSSSNGFSAPLAMEVGLGNEVQKARKILAGLLAEEKRIREEKEKEAADCKRENAQVLVKKAIKAAKEGGDPRSLSRAIARATRTILDKDDETIVQANVVASIISDLEKTYSTIRTATRDRDLEALSEFLPRANSLLTEIKKKGGGGAGQRAFGGGDPNKVLIEGDKLRNELQEKRERAKQEEQRAKDMEKVAKDKLEAVMRSNDIVALELATKQATEALLSKSSELGTTIEAAKKVLAKWVKGERRKLKQARNSNDPEIIDKTAAAASQLGLQSLQSDIDGAKAHAQKLREQSEALKILNKAVAGSDAKTLIDIRNRLTKLGMFSEAEKARAEVERLQRVKRARTLLEGAVDDAVKSRSEIKNILSLVDGNEDGNDAETADAIANAENDDESKTSKANSGSGRDALTLFSTLNWPDVQRLHELSVRARGHGQSSLSLCHTAENLVSELASLGRQVLNHSVHSTDAQAIASVVAGFEKSFLSVPNPEVFDRVASETAIANAKKRLAAVQALDQEQVKAESAQVKVEYAIATSRRTTAARHRSSKCPSASIVETSAKDSGYAQSGHEATELDVHGAGNVSSNSKQSNVHNSGNRISYNQQFQSSHEVPSVNQVVAPSNPPNQNSTNIPPFTVITRAHGKAPGVPYGHRPSMQRAKIERSGALTSEGQSHSSISSDCGDEEIVDNEIHTSVFKEHAQVETLVQNASDNNRYLESFRTTVRKDENALAYDYLAATCVATNSNPLETDTSTSIGNLGSSRANSVERISLNSSSNRSISTVINHRSSQNLKRNDNMHMGGCDARRSCDHPSTSSDQTTDDLTGYKYESCSRGNPNSSEKILDNRKFKQTPTHTSHNLDNPPSSHQIFLDSNMMREQQVGTCSSIPAQPTKSVASSSACSHLSFYSSGSASVSIDNFFSQRKGLRGYGFDGSGVCEGSSNQYAPLSNLSTTITNGHVSHHSENGAEGSFVTFNVRPIGSSAGDGHVPTFPVMQSSTSGNNQFASRLCSAAASPDSCNRFNTRNIDQSEVRPAPSSNEPSTRLPSILGQNNSFGSSKCLSINMDQHHESGCDRPLCLNTGYSRLNLSTPNFDNMAAMRNSISASTSLMANPTTESVANPLPRTSDNINLSAIPPNHMPSHHRRELITHNRNLRTRNDAEGDCIVPRLIHQQQPHQPRTDIVHNNATPVGVVTSFSAAAFSSLDTVPQLDAGLNVPGISNINSPPMIAICTSGNEVRSAGDVCTRDVNVNGNINGMNDFRSTGSHLDIGFDFENENFGFDINTIVDDVSPPPSISENNITADDPRAPISLDETSDDENNTERATAPVQRTHNPSVVHDTVSQGLRENENCVSRIECEISSVVRATGNSPDDLASATKLGNNEGRKKSKHRFAQKWNRNDDESARE